MANERRRGRNGGNGSGIRREDLQGERAKRLEAELTQDRW